MFKPVLLTSNKIMKTNSLSKSTLLFSILLFLINSCASKKDVIYFQDIDKLEPINISAIQNTIQPNDILKITVDALIPEAAIPYNRFSRDQSTSLELTMLDGYLVSPERIINFPVLGKIYIGNITTFELEDYIEDLLIKGGYLSDPTVSVRLLNGKVTVLGEVKSPGTFQFRENKLSLLQALGLAGDLNINGDRENIIILRTIDGVQKKYKIDLTSINWLDSEYSYILPNDIILVSPNNSKIKMAGYVGDASVVLSIVSTLLTAIIIITNL